MITLAALVRAWVEGVDAWRHTFALLVKQIFASFFGASLADACLAQLDAVLTGGGCGHVFVALTAALAFFEAEIFANFLVTKPLNTIFSKRFCTLLACRWLSVCHWTVVFGALAVLVQALHLAQFVVTQLDHTNVADCLTISTGDLLFVTLNGATIGWALVLDKLAQVKL